jgi:hypothetical protein
LYGTDYPDRLKKVGFIIPEKNFLEEIDVYRKKRYALPEKEFMYGYRKPEKIDLKN